MRKTLLLCAAAFCAACTVTPEKQARELIAKMTLEEKTGQMMSSTTAIEALGIPDYNWWGEALHGVARNGKATVFPMPIGMAASFDEPLVHEVFTAVSDEARVKNRQAIASGHVGWYQGLSFWTPNINIFREPRWNSFTPVSSSIWASCRERVGCVICRTSAALEMLSSRTTVRKYFKTLISIRSPLMYLLLLLYTRHACKAI